MTAQKRLQYHRLSDLDEWEFYEVEVDGEKYTIGLRPYTEFRAAEYALWDGDAENKRGTGSVPCENVGARWPDASREEILRSILTIELSQKSER